MPAMVVGKIAHLEGSVGGGDSGNQRRRVGAAGGRSRRCWDGPGRRRQCRDGLGPKVLAGELLDDTWTGEWACGERLMREERNGALKIYRNYFQYETKTEPEGRPEGSPRGSRCHPSAPQEQAAAGAHLGTSLASSRRLFAYKFTPDLKTQESPIIFPEDVRGRRHLQP